MPGNVPKPSLLDCIRDRCTDVRQEKCTLNFDSAPTLPINERLAPMQHGYPCDLMQNLKPLKCAALHKTKHLLKVMRVVL